ncbi:MAG: hypothetical protein ABI237_04245 [Ginsengibacter sp.]
MRKVLLLVIVAVAFSACKKDFQNNGIIGKWKLTRFLADPGDGSGTWQPADLFKPQYLEFTADGMLIYSPTNPNNLERYNVTSDSTMIFSRNNEDLSIGYHVAGNILTIHFPCFEPCGLEYIAVKP